MHENGIILCVRTCIYFVELELALLESIMSSRILGNGVSQLDSLSIQIYMSNLSHAVYIHD